MSKTTNVLIRHHYISIPDCNDVVGTDALATILMNLAYYGHALNVEAYKALSKLDPQTLADWWADVEVELKEITGANRKLENFVVYKNFPAEVLNKTEAEYWLPQILMYWGFPNELFTEPVKTRAKMSEKTKTIVLQPANQNTLKSILNSYVRSPARWKDQERDDVLFLSQNIPVNFAAFGFKENLVLLASAMIANNREINLRTATDVLRLAAGLSDGDVSLRTKFKFKSFKKPVRKYLLSMLEKCNNLSEDFARNPELWKRLIHQLHPGDYKRQFPRVCKVADELYKGSLVTFNSEVEQLLANRDVRVLDVLTTRPGDFRRRLVHVLDLFGDKAAKAFISSDVLDKLTTSQIVGMRTYLETVNSRFQRCFPPKGNWSKLQIGEARWVEEKHVQKITKALTSVLRNRVPKVKVLDPETANIKLASNDGEVSPYARGTVFKIPNSVKFIRTASYWQKKTMGCNWFDNGWNFFDSNWNPVGVCCWNAERFPAAYDYYGSYKKGTPSANTGAIFSGDPTNSKEMDGKAAQLIDLYPKQLKAAGVRYAVWNILCYSRIAFGDADDVFAALQWGEDPQTGKLFEPSRCQLAFPLRGDSMTKYICLIDLETMEMVYLDANLAGSTSSASMNGNTLQKSMPAYMEYLKSLPSVHDLFRESVSEKSDVHVLYSDKDVELNDVPAFVFRPENKENKFTQFDLNAVLT